MIETFTYLDDLQFVLVNTRNIRNDLKFLYREQSIIIDPYSRVDNTWATEPYNLTLPPADDLSVFYRLWVKQRIKLRHFVYIFYLVRFLVFLNVVAATWFLTWALRHRLELTNPLGTLFFLAAYHLNFTFLILNISIRNSVNKRLHFHEPDLLFRCNSARRVCRWLNDCRIKHQATLLYHGMLSIINIFLALHPWPLHYLHLLVTFE